MLNQCNFIGNCGKDPEIRYTQSGTAVATTTIAVSEKYKDQNGETRENTEWVSIVAWNKLADIFKNYVHKGDKIFVSGKMKTRNWEDRDGGKHKTTEIIVAQVELLGNKRQASDGGGAPAPAAPRQSDASGDAGITEDDIPF